MHDESDYNRKSEFKIFKQTIPYGHFTWNDQSIRHLEAKKVNLTDLMKCVSENDKIPIIDIDRALKLVKDKGPLEFLGTGEECSFTKKDCVKGVPSALVLRIAQKKGLDLNDLDFVFGGSTLGVLAERHLPPKSWNDKELAIFIVQRIRGIISVRKFPNYTWRVNAIGAQFETLMIDGQFDSEDNPNRHENITLLNIADAELQNKFSVLCFAEIDGHVMDLPEHNITPDSIKSPQICEMKVVNLKYSACELPLQMISNNSTILLHGEKQKTGKKFFLADIKKYDREVIIGRYHSESIKARENNILYCLKQLKNHSKNLKENKVYLLSFNNEELQIKKPASNDFDDCQIRSEVVNSLFS